MEKTAINNMFKDELRKGTGKAVMLMHQHSGMDFSVDIIQSCLYNPDYHTTVYESGRGQYLFELISHLKNKDHVKQELIITFLIATDKKMSWSQMFELMCLYAKTGDGHAKAAIYKKFLELLPNKEGLGEKEIITLDGIQGLMHVAHHVGYFLSKSEDSWDASEAIYQYQELHPNGDPWIMLRKESHMDKSINVYLHMAQQYRPVLRKTAGSSYQQLSAIIEKRPVRLEAIKPNVLEHFARDLATETNEKVLQNRLASFMNNQFPLDYHILMKLTDHKNILIKHYAYQALSHFKNEEVRNLAIDNLKQGRLVIDSLDILKKNYRPEDDRLILKVLNRERNESYFKDISFELWGIYLNHKPGTHGVKALLKVYEKVIDPNLRQDVVEILARHHLLPAKIKQEAKYDCNLRTRALVASLN